MKKGFWITLLLGMASSAWADSELNGTWRGTSGVITGDDGSSGSCTYAELNLYVTATEFTLFESGVACEGSRYEFRTQTYRIENHRLYYKDSREASGVIVPPNYVRLDALGPGTYFTKTLRMRDHRLELTLRSGSSQGPSRQAVISLDKVPSPTL